jgi:hypothetical protein
MIVVPSALCCLSAPKWLLAEVMLDNAVCYPTALCRWGLPPQMVWRTPSHDYLGDIFAILDKVIDKKANDVLALKGNQGTLREDVELFAAEPKARGFADTTVSRDETVDGDHGRIEATEPPP